MWVEYIEEPRNANEAVAFRMVEFEEMVAYIAHSWDTELHQLMEDRFSVMLDRAFDQAFRRDFWLWTEELT